MPSIWLWLSYTLFLLALCVGQFLQSVPWVLPWCGKSSLLWWIHYLLLCCYDQCLIVTFYSSFFQLLVVFFSHLIIYMSDICRWYSPWFLFCHGTSFPWSFPSVYMLVLFGDIFRYLPSSWLPCDCGMSRCGIYLYVLMDHISHYYHL